MDPCHELTSLLGMRPTDPITVIKVGDIIIPGICAKYVTKQTLKKCKRIYVFTGPNDIRLLPKKHILGLFRAMPQEYKETVYLVGENRFVNVDEKDLSDMDLVIKSAQLSHGSERYIKETFKRAGVTAPMVYN